jgi:VCBS repeat-containing protein
VTIAPNRPPVATNGTLNVQEDRSASGRLSATDADGNPLVFTIVANGSRGTATITNAAQGRYSYVPGPNANGTDTFTFQASDGASVSNVATVLVTIAPVNDAPVAVDTAVVTSVNTPVTGAFAVTDVDGDSITFAIARAPRRGAVTVGVTGSYTYTPQAGFSGNDSFTFRASDGTTSARATVTVTVQ